jgi:excisionase family DNA binding protein
MNNASEKHPVQLMTPQQAAEALAISPRKLWAMTSTGEISHIRLGRCVRYSVDDLREMIERKKQGGADP